jgi:hypothetical protein
MRGRKLSAAKKAPAKARKKAAPKAKSKAKAKAIAKTKVIAKTKSKPKPQIERDNYHLDPRSEEEHVALMSEDLRDAWYRLKETFLSYGPQRTYTSFRSLMFARKTCHAFVRPKKTYLELCFFLREAVDSPMLKAVTQVSKTKYSHAFALKHSDQVEPPLTDWLREAFEQSGP